MNEMAATLVSCLARTSGWLSLAAIVAFVLLRGLRCRSPGMHRAAWALVLLAGWAFVRGSVTIPWYERPSVARPLPPPPTSEVIEAPQSAEPLPASAAADAAPREVGAAPTDSPPQAGASGVFWPALLAGGWLLGLLAIVGYWLVGYVRFVRALPFGLPLTEEWEAEWRDSLADCGVRRSVRLCVANAAGPLTCRVWGGYRLLVPAGLWHELSSPERRAILRHELAHVRRGDLVTSLVARCLALPHWFNPFAWWAVRNFEECGEWACDDSARGREPADAPAYARVLLRLGQADRQPRFGAAIGGRRLSTRIKRILTGALPEDSTMKKSVLVGSIGLVMFIAAVEWRFGPRGAGAGEQELEGTPSQPNVGRALLERLARDAAKTYEATTASYDVGTSIMADVYVWSRRWLDAERNLARTDAEEIVAMRAHRHRMKNLFLKVNALYTTGSKGGELEKFHATKYYLAEADVWLAEARSRATGKQESVEDVRVSFEGPAGMIVTWDEKGQGEFDSERLVTPAAHDFAAGQIYRLRIGGFKDAADVKLIGTLELAASAERDVPVDIGLAEVKRIVLDNTGLTKVFYRAEDGRIGTVSAEGAKPEEHLVAEAEARGEMQAILRIGQGR
jgi:beta-lactamase regulating signal transducer with metallopeptidase domain